MKTFENYPTGIVIMSILFSILIYIIGAYILYKLWVGFFVLYVVYCFWCEKRVLRKSCINCYYYGKRCCFGRGKLCSWIFKKGNAREFIKTKISWIHILPDFLVAIFPIIGAVALLIINFSWSILILIIILIILFFVGTPAIRGYSCAHCKQRRLGCPAEQLFNKKEGKKK